MKRETLRHPKTYDLASRLKRSRPEVLGFLTLLWDYAADAAPQGDVGKWPNGAIARACDWLDDPDEFVAALVKSKWLDECPKHRLVIHDWADHAERWLKLKLERTGLEIISTERSKVPSTEASTERSVEGPTEAPQVAFPSSTEASIERSPPRDLTKPNLTKPRESAKRTPADAGSSSSSEFENEVVSAWNASGLPKCSKVTDSRRRALKARSAEADWKANWRAGIERVRSSAFCRGQNDRGWKADIDWFLKPDTLTKLLEGKYAAETQQAPVSERPQGQAPTVGRSGFFENITDAEREQIAREHSQKVNAQALEDHKRRLAAKSASATEVST